MVGAVKREFVNDVREHERGLRAALRRVVHDGEHGPVNGAVRQRPTGCGGDALARFFAGDRRFALAERGQFFGLLRLWRTGGALRVLQNDDLVRGGRLRRV